MANIETSDPFDELETFLHAFLGKLDEHKLKPGEHCACQGTLKDGHLSERNRVVALVDIGTCQIVQLLRQLRGQTCQNK